MVSLGSYSFWRYVRYESSLNKFDVGNILFVYIYTYKGYKRFTWFLVLNVSPV